MKYPDSKKSKLLSIHLYLILTLIASIHLPAYASGRYQVIELKTLGGSSSSAAAINNRGQVAGTSKTEGDVEGHVVIWQNGKIIDLGNMGSNDIDVVDINEQGQVLGHFNVSKEGYLQHGYIYIKGQMIDLGSLGGGSDFDTLAHDINDHGQVVGESVAMGAGFHAFLWQRGKMFDLGTLGGDGSGAYAINNRGQIVGISETVSGSGIMHAFLWQNGKMFDLGTLGGSRSDALAINEHGQVFGYSYDRGRP